MTNESIAKEIIEALGGLENIESVAHCATRLRVIVKEQEQVNQKAVEEIEIVKGSFFNSGQLQIILGTGTVNKIYEGVVKLGAPTHAKLDQLNATKREGNPFKRLIRAFGDVFVPIVPVLVATGLFMGFRGAMIQPEILNFYGLTLDQIPSNFLIYIEILTDTAFIFLPALIAMSAFKIFGGTPMIGLILGLMLVSPSLPNAWKVAGGDVEPIIFFNMIPVVGYQASVIPAFIAGILGAKFEQKVRTLVPETLDLILTPFITLLIMSTLALFVIGPIFRSVEGGIIIAVTTLLAWPLGIGGALIGFFHQLVVVTGVHHVLGALEMALLSDTGANAFNAIISCAMAAQGGATLAVGVKTKSKRIKALSFSSFLSVLLGITEPAIFGINLRYIKPFILGLVGGAIGGLFAALLGLQGTGMGITLLPGMLLYLNGQLLKYIFVTLVSIGAGFVLTWSFGYSDKMQD